MNGEIVAAILQISLRTKHSFTQQENIIMILWCFLGFDLRRQSGFTQWVKQLQGDCLVSLVKHQDDAYSVLYKSFLLIAVWKANNKKGNLNSFPSILLTPAQKSWQLPDGFLVFTDFSRNYFSWYLYGMKWHKKAVGVEFLSLNLLILQSVFRFPQLENILKQK